MRWPGGVDGDDRSIITGAPREVGTVRIPGSNGPRYYVGLDLGQSADFTALVVLQQEGTPQPQDVRRAGTWGRDQDRPAPATPPLASYQVRHLERFALGTPYPAIVTQVRELLQHPPLHQGTSLVVDATGVGRPVIDLLLQAQLDPIAVSIHGGDQVTHERRYWRVPKRDLVGSLQVLLQSQRLKVAAALPLAQTLVQELLNFRVTINPQTAHDSYAAWREADHDDLVLATALACWCGEQGETRPGIMRL